MRCKFPYFEDRPHIPIILEHDGEQVRFLPLLDTGADYSVFYEADALRLGLDWQKGKLMHLENADGTQFETRQFLLKMNIEGKIFKAPVSFVKGSCSAIPLLGRQEVFKQFFITICESEKYVEMWDY